MNPSVEEIAAALAAVDVYLSPYQLSWLTQRASTVDGAINYYFENKALVDGLVDEDGNAIAIDNVNGDLVRDLANFGFDFDFGEDELVRQQLQQMPLAPVLPPQAPVLPPQAPVLPPQAPVLPPQAPVLPPQVPVAAPVQPQPQPQPQAQVVGKVKAQAQKLKQAQAKAQPKPKLMEKAGQPQVQALRQPEKLPVQLEKFPELYFTEPKTGSATVAECYPSLISGANSSNKTIAEVLISTPRLEVRCLFPFMLRHKGIVQLLPEIEITKSVRESRVFVLKGTADELLQNCRRSFQIEDDRSIKVLPVPKMDNKDAIKADEKEEEELFSRCVDGDALFVGVEGLQKVKIIFDQGSVLAIFDMKKFRTMEELTAAVCQRMRLSVEDYTIGRPASLAELQQYPLGSYLFQNVPPVDIEVVPINKDFSITVIDVSSLVPKECKVNIPIDKESWNNVVGLIATQCDLLADLFVDIKAGVNFDVCLSETNYEEYLVDEAIVHLSYCCSCLQNGALAQRRSREMEMLRKVSADCMHTLCSHCISNKLNDAALIRPKFTTEPEDFNPVASVYCYADVPANLVGINLSDYDIFQHIKLVDVSCAKAGCPCILGSEDVQDVGRGIEDFNRAFIDLNKHLNILSTYRLCCLEDLLCCCDDGPEDVEKLNQLGCDHFYHIACIASQISADLEKAKQDPRPIVCPECVRINHCCTCLPCSGRADYDQAKAHQITEQEIKAMCNSELCPNFTVKQKELWELESQMYFFKHMPGYKVVICRCGNAIAFGNLDGVAEIQCPYKCEYVICGLCEREAHPGKTCDQAEADIAIQDVEGLMLQRCPDCNAPYDLNIDCLHSTCLRCKSQYCFLCTTSYTQYLNHNTQAYHRKGCSFYETHCCDEKCREQDLPRCKNAKYLPGPCENCRNGDINTHNSCTHDRGDWKACGDCLRSNVKCKHWCVDCEKKGSACDFPLDMKPDGTPYKYYSHEEVKAEEARRKEKK